MAIVKKCRHPKEDWDRCSCQWYLDHRVDGKRVYEPIRSPEDVRPTGSFATAAQEWLAGYEDGNPATYSTYRGVVQKLCEIFDGWKPEEITGRILDQFSADVDARYSSSYARTYHDVLVKILKTAGVTVAPHIAPKVPKVKKHIPLTTAEVQEIIAAMPDETRGLTLFAAMTGMRIGELLGLKPEDLDGGGIWVRRQRLPNEVVRRPKTDSGIRHVQLGPRALELLGDGEWCFPVSYRKAQDHLYLALNRTGYYQPGVGWHILRHYNASLRERVGQGLRGAQGELGHSASSQTLSYGWGEAQQSIAADLENHFHE